ncbi:MAG TPA: NAD(P)/FAD-dependent oxidoreductase [Reyranella sp.]|nr:NAD(P)/FAD-dependent oxidoreductase [Reyranella sp.]
MRRRSLLAAPAIALLARSATAAEPEVAIVGAGIAGLAAARTLMAANRPCLVLEVRQRIGGRTFTDTGLGFPFDHGAAGIEGELARELGAKTAPAVGTASIYVHGKALTEAEYAQFAKASAADAKMIDKVAKELPGVDPRQVINATSPLERLALAERLRRTPFAPEPSAVEGVGTLVARFGAKVPVKLGVKVIRFDSTGPTVQVVSAAGEWGVKAVIVTVPVGVLAAGELSFAPPLKADRKAAIAALSSGSYDKVAIAFTRKVLDVPADTRLIGLTRAETVVDLLLRPQGKEAAIMLCEGEEARQLEAAGPSAAGATALSAVAEIFGKEVRTAFAGSQSTRWTQDPFSRGAWSVGPDKQRAVLAAPHDERIFFAGEATDSGRLDGAYVSGVRAAKEALALLGRR